MSYPGTRSVPAVDVESAARLVAHGMRPKALPARDPAYADLVRRYREDDVFADTVQRIASGLGLTPLFTFAATTLLPFGTSCHVGPAKWWMCWPLSVTRSASGTGDPQLPAPLQV